MKLNPFHPSFGLTRHARNKRHVGKLRILRDYQADSMIGVTHFANRHSELHRLCQKHGTDKGHTDIATHPCGGLAGRTYTHNYAAVYDLLFAQKRMQIKNLLECGIGAVSSETKGSMSWASNTYKPGASLRTWQEYFPNAQIVGLDVDADALFTDERIETYQCDQTDPQSIRDFLAKVGERKFDIIIDDGLHEFRAGVTLFESTIERLEDDGVYVIEDVNTDQLSLYAAYFKNSKYLVRFVHMPETEVHAGYASLLVISKQAGEPK